MTSTLAITSAVLSDFGPLVRLQRLVWGSSFDAVPAHQLQAHHHWGGHVHVARHEDDIVGFAYAYPAVIHGAPTLHSHLLAVLPSYRGRGLATDLKLTQARWARQHGFSRVTWTFDPLQPLNAALNLHRLGVFARTYLPDHYGPLRDDLNAGLPTDRLLAEWHLDYPDVRALLDHATRPARGAARQTVPLPHDFQHLKRSDPPRALQTQRVLRAALQQAFAEDLVATDFRGGAYHLRPAKELDLAH